MVKKINVLMIVTDIPGEDPLWVVDDLLTPEECHEPTTVHSPFKILERTDVMGSLVPSKRQFIVS